MPGSGTVFSSRPLSLLLSLSLSLSHPPQPLGEMIVHLVGPQVLLESGELRVGVDDGEFDSGHGGEVLEVLLRDRVAVGGVMRTAGQDPRRARGLEVGAAFPYCACHGKL